MNPFSGFFDGPRSLLVFWRLLDKRAWLLFFLYYLVAGGVVLGFALAVVALGPDAKQALVDYIFPEHWRMAGRMVSERFFGKLGSKVLANFILNGSMAAISMSCFAIKEILSRRIEHNNPLLEQGHAPWPLWRQAVEELKFAVMYLVAYDVIFWIAYPPWETNRIAAQVLSFVVLFVFFNITFLCPLFLRHRVGYGRMVRTFFARPFSAFGFAGLFLAPSLVVAAMLQGQPLKTVIATLLGIHVLTVAPAASAGTWVAARLLPVAKTMRPSGLFSRLLAALSMLAILGASGYVFAQLADSIHKKTQILKCTYRIDWSSFELEPPSLSNLSVGLSVDIEITNPTAVDVLIESSRLEITNNKKHFSTVQLGRIEVPAGETRRERVAMRIEIALSRLLEYKDLIDKPWEFVLWVQVDEHWEFPVFFR